MSTILDDKLKDFKLTCNSILEQYFASLILYNENEVSGFSSDMKNQIVESLFLKASGYWEGFIEDIFISYMMNNKSEAGDSIVVYVHPRDRTHAYNMVKGVLNYPDWTDISKILIYAGIFFEKSGPFSLLNTLKSELNQIKTIRNAVAHSSKKAKQDFEKLVRGLIGHLPDDITPSIFLSEYKRGKKKTSPTYFEHYISFLMDSASMLVEFKAESI